MASAHHQLIQQGPHFSAPSTTKTKDKSRRMICSGISVVAFASVYSEKTRLKKLMIMIIIIITKKHLLVNEKGDVGMANRFSKKYGNKG